MKFLTRGENRAAFTHCHFRVVRKSWYLKSTCIRQLSSQQSANEIRTIEHSDKSHGEVNLIVEVLSDLTCSALLEIVAIEELLGFADNVPRTGDGRMKMHIYSHKHAPQSDRGGRNDILLVFNK